MPSILQKCNFKEKVRERKFSKRCFQGKAMKSFFIRLDRKIVFQGNQGSMDGMIPLASE